MRGINTPIVQIREAILERIAEIAWKDGDRKEELARIPYDISPDEEPKYRESVWRERAISSERVRLALGLSLRPGDKDVPMMEGFAESNIDKKYYEPPLMQVIPSACEACEDNKYEVSNMCRACVAHPCMEVCPTDAITFVDGRAYIHQDKCVRCGRCREVCPYSAIIKKERPCYRACGVHAITDDKYHRAYIDQDKCVSCGQCMAYCPFGAISDKSQIYQMIQAMKSDTPMIAELAPAFEGQFGKPECANQLREALLDLGFADVYEVAMGADMGAMAEAEHYVNAVVNGDQEFLLTSCCPSWAVMAKKCFPEMKGHISQELTPMVATARVIKKEHPDARVVFIGPCAAKKLEAARKSVRSDVDFVVTFAELKAVLKSRNIKLENYEPGRGLHQATAAGRGYAVAGGVADAIEACLDKYYPGVEAKVEHAEGLSQCSHILKVAKTGDMEGCLIEGMACPGGCVGGVGTVLSIPKAKAAVAKAKRASRKKVPEKTVAKKDGI